jgi:hypothetical protein
MIAPRTLIRKGVRPWLALGVLIAAPTYADLIEFNDGDPASAQEVNQNFDAVMAAIADVLPSRVIPVSADAGAENLNQVVGAITDSSPENPYTILLGPGTHTLTETLSLPVGVNLRGMGAAVSAIECSSCTTLLELSSAASTTLSDLSIGSTQLAEGVVKIISVPTVGGVNTVGQLIIERVNIFAAAPNAAQIFGLWVEGTLSTLKLDRVDVEGSAAQNVVGIYAQGQNTSVLLNQINVDVENADIAYGIWLGINGTTGPYRAETNSVNIRSNDVSQAYGFIVNDGLVSLKGIDINLRGSVSGIGLDVRTLSSGTIENFTVDVQNFVASNKGMLLVDNSVSLADGRVVAGGGASRNEGIVFSGPKHSSNDRIMKNVIVEAEGPGNSSAHSTIAVTIVATDNRYLNIQDSFFIGNGGCGSVDCYAYLQSLSCTNGCFTTFVNTGFQSVTPVALPNNTDFKCLLSYDSFTRQILESDCTRPVN